MTIIILLRFLIFVSKTVRIFNSHAKIIIYNIRVLSLIKSLNYTYENHTNRSTFHKLKMYKVIYFTGDIRLI